MMSRPARRAFACIGGIAYLAGCYEYQPVSGALAPTVLDPGSEVRLELSSDGAARLEPLLGPRTVAVEGRIDSATDTAVVLAVSGTRKDGATASTLWSGGQVTVPRTAIAGLQRRTLDKKRTFFAAGIAVVGAVLIKVIVSAVGSDSGGDDGGGTPTPP